MVRGDIHIMRRQRATYAELRYRGSSISLGLYDELSPTAILDCVLNALHRLTDYELQVIHHADKSWREGRRHAGRPRKTVRRWA